MAEWWEAAPIVEQPRQRAGGGNWWEAAPLVDQPQQARPPAAQPEQQAAPRGIRQRLYDNIIGDPNDGVTSTGEALGTWLNRAGDTASLGFLGDEASATVYAPVKRAMGSDATYASERDRFRANQEAMSTAARLSADVAGAIVPALAGVGVIAGGTGLAARAARGAAVGAGTGAISGFNQGEGGFSNRLSDAALYGGIGAGVGAAIPAVASGVRRAYSGARQAISDRATGRQIAQQTGVSPRAGRLAADVIGMDDPSRMRNALARPDAMLADAGPSTQGALDAAIQSPGEGARTALGRIDARASRAGERLTGALDDAMPAQLPQGRQFTDTSRMQGDVRAATAAERQQLYTRAYAQPIDYSSAQGSALLDSITPRLPGEAVNYANRLMRLRGEQSSQIMAQIADDGSVSFTRPPDVRQWDYIKQALDGLAESGDGAGALGGQTRLGAAYQGLAREIRSNLGRAVPEYDQAVNRAGDIIGEVRAIKTGEQLLSARVTRAEAESLLDGMSQAETSAVKRGLRQSIDDRLAQVRAVATDPNVDVREVQRAYGELSSRAARDKMRMLLGDDWPAVENALDDAGQALGLRARVATNSRTFGRQQFGEMLDESTEPGALRRGEVLGTARGAWQRVTGASPARVARQRGEVRNELADLLTRPNALNVLEVIEQARTQNALAPDTGALLEYLSNAGALGANALSSRQ